MYSLDHRGWYRRGLIYLSSANFKKWHSSVIESASHKTSLVWSVFYRFELQAEAIARELPMRHARTEVVDILLVSDE